VYYVMGPYLVFEEKRPSFWLSWSMEKNTIQTIFVADYHNGSWQERLPKDTAEAEFFYVYDVAATAFCLVFNQSKVDRILPLISQHEPRTTTVNQVQRLQCNDQRWFYHVNPFVRAVADDPTVHRTQSQPSYFINTNLFPTLYSRELLDSIKERHHALGLPIDLTEKQPAAVPTHSEKFLKALDLDDLVQELNDPLCFLLTSPPNEINNNELFLWLENNICHYVWPLNGVLLTGEIQGEHHRSLIDALCEIPSNTPKQAIHEVLKEKKLLQTITSECLDLSLNQQKLIVARLIFDGIWPEIDSVSDENRLKDLLFSFIDRHRSCPSSTPHDEQTGKVDLQKTNKSPASLEEIRDGFHQFMDPKCLISIAQQSKFYDTQDIDYHAGSRARLASVHQFIYHLVCMAMRNLDIDTSSVCIPECNALNPESLIIGENLTRSLQESAQTLSVEESLVYKMLYDFDVEYLYEELKSATEAIKLLEEKNPRVALLSSLLSAEYGLLLISEGSDPAHDLSEAVEFRMLSELQRLASKISLRETLLYALDHWNEEVLLKACQTPKELIYSFNRQTSDEKIKQLMVNNKTLIKRRLNYQFKSYCYIFTHLTEPRRTIFVSIFFTNVFTRQINSAKTFVDFLKNSVDYSPEFIAAVASTVIADGGVIQSCSDYETVLHELWDQPDLLDVIFPYLATVHRDIFSRPNALNSFLFQLNDKATTWWFTLNNDMKVDLLSFHKPFLFLQQFKLPIQKKIILLFNDALIPLIISGQSVASFLDNCSLLRQMCFINDFAALNMRFLPVHLQIFSSSVQAQLLYACASKLQLTSLNDLKAWLKGVVTTNQHIILKIATSKGSLSRWINSNEQLNEILTSVDSTSHDLLLNFLAPHLVHSIRTLDELALTLGFLSPTHRVKLVQIVQDDGFEYRALPRLRLSTLTRMQKTKFFLLYFEMFQHERSLDADINNLVVTPLLNHRDGHRKNKMNQLKTGLSWLRHYLVGCASPFEELNLMIQINLMHDRVLSPFRVRVEESLDRFVHKKEDAQFVAACSS